MLKIKHELQHARLRHARVLWDNIRGLGGLDENYEKL